MRTVHRTPRRGFTLVELLVVITIIGLLVALMVPAAFIVLRNARNSRISLEIASIAQAIEAYKLEAGDYPPNFNDQMLLRRHIAKRWQQIPATEVQAFISKASEIDPAEALVFWLGGALKNNDILPLSGAGEPKVFYSFEQGRLTDRDGDGFMEYAAPYGMNAPFVYFDARAYAHYYNSANEFNVGTIDGTARGVVRPAPRVAIANASSATQEQFVNPTTYQIIAPGQDGLFGGSTSAYPEGPWTNADRDNVTNFSEGKTLEDARP